MPASPVTALAFPEFTRTARIRPPLSFKCAFETIKGAAMKVFCVKTAAVVAGVSEQINARSRAPFALIPAATAAVLNPLTTIVLLSITLCVARTARRRREGTLARGERRDGGHAVPSLTPGTRYLL